VKGAVGQIQAIVERLQASDASFAATVCPSFAREPFEVPRDARIVQVLAGEATAVLGRPPAFVGDTPWMDAALLAAAGIETVVMGPIGSGEHSAVEWVDLDSVVRTAEILGRAAVAYCA
jgi:acetylornithine deacetylase